ncbi:MAG: MFS transporter [Pseudomonadota bacterium]
MSDRAHPYWRLSAFYFAYFAVLGAMVPFWSLFLQDRGFSLTDIALLTAIPMATRIVAPNLWGWIADHRQQRLPIVRLGSLAAILLFCGVWFVDSFAGMALVMTGYSFFWNAVLPQFEVVTLNHLGPRIAEYSRVRLWGSIGFIGAVIGLGAVFDLISVAWLPAFMLALMVAMWVSAWTLGEVQEARHERRGSDTFAVLLRQPVVWMLLLACLLINLSHGPYYTYFSIHLEERGWTRLGIGGLWALGVIAEVLVFIYMHRILNGLGAVRVLAGAATGVVVRWLLLAYLVDSLAALLLAQVLHAVTFGFLHAAAIHLAHRLFTGSSQGRGQALFSSVSYGVGGAGGALLAGALWPYYGAQVAFVAMSAVGVAALLIVIFMLARSPLLGGDDRVPADEPLREGAAE